MFSGLKRSQVQHSASSASCSLGTSQKRHNCPLLYAVCPPASVTLRYCLWAADNDYLQLIIWSFPFHFCSWYIAWIQRCMNQFPIASFNLHFLILDSQEHGNLPWADSDHWSISLNIVNRDWQQLCRVFLARIIFLWPYLGRTRMNVESSLCKASAFQSLWPFFKEKLMNLSSLSPFKIPSSFICVLSMQNKHFVTNMKCRTAALPFKISSLRNQQSSVQLFWPL